jgi:hypothetical protein
MGTFLKQRRTFSGQKLPFYGGSEERLEQFAPYKALFRAENNEIGLENTYFWGINIG